MTSGSPGPEAPAAPVVPSFDDAGKAGAFTRVVESLAELADDASVPRNVRRGAQSAKDELAKPRTPIDVRIASAVYVLDDLANDPNLPTHGRTAIWSIISNLESLQ